MQLKDRSWKLSSSSPFADVLKFDNTYSWTRSKEVFFSIKVLPPNVVPEESPAAGISLTPDPTLTDSQADEDEEFYECEDQVNGEATAS